MTREQQDQREDVAPHDRLLASDRVRDPPEQHEEAHPAQRADADDDLCHGILDPHRTGEEGEPAEHRGIPDDREAGGDAEQGDEDALLVARISQALDERIARGGARLFHCLEHRAFRELDAHP